MKQKKMARIFKEMAVTLLKYPNDIPSSEAAHAALLLAHVAWNRTLGETFSDANCRSILLKFEKSKPDFWLELKSKNWRSLILQLIEYKKKHYSDDGRIVSECGMRDQNIHVEWRYPDKQKRKRIIKKK